MLRNESANQEADGRPFSARVDDDGGLKYSKPYGQFTKKFSKNTLAKLKRSLVQRIYRRNFGDLQGLPSSCDKRLHALTLDQPDLRRLLWPVFIHCFLNLVSDFFSKDAKDFFNNFKGQFEDEHEDDLRSLQALSLPEHVTENPTSQLYRNHKYRVTVSQTAYMNLVQFLETKHKEAGTVITGIIGMHLNVVAVERNVENQFSLAKLLERARKVEDFPAEDEGIPGHNPGSANTDRNAGATVLTKLKLGQVILDPEGRQDVLGDLEDEDKANPPASGQISLVETFEQRIKREESEELPGRSELPPRVPVLAKDVAMEVQRIKENRDRFQIPGRTGGTGPGVSVCMYTFHNTNDWYGRLQKISLAYRLTARSALHALIFLATTIS